MNRLPEQCRRSSYTIWGDTLTGRRGHEAFVRGGMTGESPKPLERGRGHGIIGESEFIEKIRGEYVRAGVEDRELPH